MRTTVLLHWSGHQKVEGREGDQRPLRTTTTEKTETCLGGRAGMWSRWSVGQTIYWPYAPTGTVRYDDDVFQSVTQAYLD